MHVLNWRLDSYCKSLTARGWESLTFTAYWTLNWEYRQTLHHMCLIGDSIPIGNRLALLTMRCQLSNVWITVSGLKGHKIYLEALHLMLFSVFWEGAHCISVVDMTCTKEMIDYRLQHKRCDVITSIPYEHALNCKFNYKYVITSIPYEHALNCKFNYKQKYVLLCSFKNKKLIKVSYKIGT